jgi:hypothetical protein
MKVIYHNRSAVDAGLPATQLPLDQVLQADIVVIAVPGGPATHHLISTAQLAQMRPEAFLINIARGDVVDEAALVAALQNRQIAGAGLDVYEFEPRVSPALMAMGATVQAFDPEGIVVNPRNGNLIVSDEYGPSVYEFNRSGQLTKVFVTPDNLIPRNATSGTANFASDVGNDADIGLLALAFG